MAQTNVMPSDHKDQKSDEGPEVPEKQEEQNGPEGPEDVMDDYEDSQVQVWNSLKTDGEKVVYDDDPEFEKDLQAWLGGWVHPNIAK